MRFILVGSCVFFLDICMFSFSVTPVASFIGVSIDKSTSTSVLGVLKPLN